MGKIKPVGSIDTKALKQQIRDLKDQVEALKIVNDAFYMVFGSGLGRIKMIIKDQEGANEINEIIAEMELFITDPAEYFRQHRDELGGFRE